MVAGLAAGFATAFLFLKFLDRSTAAPFEVTFQLKAERPWQVQLGPGWGATSNRGTLVSGKVARVKLPLDRVPELDLVLDVELWLERAGSPVKVELAANGKPIGAVKVANSGVYRVLLPAATLGRAKAVEIAVATDAMADSLLVETISLRDITTLGNLSGHVDACSKGSIVGWAMSDELPAPVTIRREGGGVLKIMPSETRADIKRSGRALTVGFTAHLAPPLRPGERVDVALPNGNTLIGSPCRG